MNEKRMGYTPSPNLGRESFSRQMMIIMMMMKEWNKKLPILVSSIWPLLSSNFWAIISSQGNHGNPPTHPTRPRVGKRVSERKRSQENKAREAAGAAAGIHHHHHQLQQEQQFSFPTTITIIPAAVVVVLAQRRGRKGSEEGKAGQQMQGWRLWKGPSCHE